MKKQANLMVGLSAAAVLSAGITMTAFGSTGWMQEQDGWVYYEEDGEKAAGELLEIQGQYYYFHPDGLMTRNQWVSVDNENAGQEDEPEQHFYYFQDNGKAYKRPDDASSGSVFVKEIGEKKYSFDSEGRMLYGWVAEGERQTGADAWKDCEYYFGPEGDGAMRRGWDRIRIESNPEDEMMPSDGIWEDEDQERWFYFSSAGKKTRGKPDGLVQKTINGQKYGFDQYGRMLSSWYASPDLITINAYDKTVSAEENLTQRQGGRLYTKEFMYFGSPESGMRYTNGWFRARPSRYLMESKHLDNESYMYYADQSGNIYANEIRVIDGEKYAFDNYGRLINGFVCLTMENEKTSSMIEATWYQDKTDREFSDENKFTDLIDFERYNSKGFLVESYRYLFDSHKMRFYYFGGKNGTMLTGKQTVKLGDETFEFIFEDSGYLKGSGVYGEKDGRLYQAGMLLKPEEGHRYAVVKVESKEETVGMSLVKYKELHKIDVEEFMDEVCNSGIYDKKKDETVWTVRYEPPKVKYYLIDQNGNIVKNKKNATDEDGFRFYVDNSKIQKITVKD
ncbi:cell wall-binding protein [Lacrimispora brassicae]